MTLDHLGAFSPEEEAAKIQAVERACSGHSDGPWRVDSHGLHVFSETKLVAACGGHQDNFTPELPAINRANAVLCAAAPTLLAANQRLERDNAALRAALLASKISHNYCEDSWYSCPLAEDGCSDDRKGPGCECGAEAHNARIDKALAAPGKGVAE